jgi:type IV secretion system protein VirB11
VAIAIRRSSSKHWTIADLARDGAFGQTRNHDARSAAHETRLLDLLSSGQYEAFLRMAVLTRQNILISGPTGSGKTTWTRALIREIPSDERLITIEDACELVLDRHPNHVRLFYSKDDQGLARVSPRQLLECCLRMKPDRILLAELRSEEAFDYLRSVNSGHPGSITSVHASSTSLAFEQLMLLVKQSPAGRELPRREIRALLHLLINVVVQFACRGRQRFVEEIWYQPQRLRTAGRSMPGTR